MKWYWIVGIVVFVLIVSGLIFQYKLAKQGFGSSPFYKPVVKNTGKQNVDVWHDPMAGLTDAQRHDGSFY